MKLYQAIAAREAERMAVAGVEIVRRSHAGDAEQLEYALAAAVLGFVACGQHEAGLAFWRERWPAGATMPRYLAAIVYAAKSAVGE